VALRETEFQQTDLRGAILTGWSLKTLELRGTIMDRKQLEALALELGIQVL
jgi:uncharacterized protein YjbI with pentapeptide repeats